MALSPLSQLQKRLLAWGLAQTSTNEAGIQLTSCPEFSDLAALKRSLLGNLQGTVLEIGPGTGVNFSYYPAGIHWIGVEPNPFMLPYLHQEAERQGLKAVEVRQGTAENLPLAAAAVETVVSTHVLCSVTDLSQVLQEVRRVLKPGGSFVFIEHVAAHDGTWPRRLQDGIAPLWSTLFDHCHPNRETWTVLEQAGFDHLSYQPFQISFPIVGPHIAGVARTGS